MWARLCFAYGACPCASALRTPTVMHVMMRDVPWNVSIFGRAYASHTARLSVCVRVAYTHGDEYGGFQPPARLSAIRRAFGAPMLRIRRARSPSASGEWVDLKEGTVSHKNLGSPPPPPPPEDSPSGAPSPGRVGYGLRKGCLYVPRTGTPGGSQAERSCSRYVKSP